jgi:2-polyprenylphenol 6-hydroxylase
MPAPTPMDTDICVIGGGMVGAAAALAAANRGLDVVLWERQRPDFSPTQPGVGLGMGLRTVALNPVAEAFLLGLGVEVEGSPIKDMRIWEELGTAKLHFSAAELGVGSLGRIAENDRVVACLWKRLQDMPGVTIHLDAEITAIHSSEDSVTIEGAAGAVRARLLIAADGAASRVRALTGSEPRRFETGQAALATIVQTQRPHDQCAYQRFLRDGPVALLPGTAPNLSAVVWSQSIARSGERQSMSEADFCRTLEQSVDGVLGRVEAVDQRLVFPLIQQLAREVLPAARVVLIGDALRVLHPLAGMGVNLGFEDVSALDSHFASGGDPGQSGRLAAFARRRRTRSVTLISLMSGFQHVYAWQTPGLSWLRNAGVRFVNARTFIRQQILREALGIGPIAKALR